MAIFAIDAEDVPKLQWSSQSHRNQFVLGSNFISKLNWWTKLRVNGSFCITAHPDLSTYQATRDGKSITLLGFILDPYNPTHDNKVIIDNLLDRVTKCENFGCLTYSMGGRWVLIVNDGRKVCVFNDAAGLRQVFYTNALYGKDLWCASQPGLIARHLSLEADVEAVDFIKSCAKINREYFWPGESSPFREVSHLLPNHYLDLDLRHAVRCWPDKPFVDLNLQTAVEHGSLILKGLVKSASLRYDLVLGLTAGLDSRVVLASFLALRNKISAITVQQQKHGENFADLTVPRRLASQLGFTHHVIRSAQKVRDDFAEMYREHVLFSHDVWLPDAQAILDYSRLEKVVVTGSVSEAARCHYREYRDRRLSAQKLCMMQGRGMKSKFSLRYSQKWIDDLGDIYNYHPIDIFYLEQRAGNWLAMCQQEFDTAWKDIFTPFNCRELLVDMLSVEEKYRRSPNYELYRRLILNLWSAALAEPINPHENGFRYRLNKARGVFRTKVKKIVYTINNYA